MDGLADKEFQLASTVLDDAVGKSQRTKSKGEMSSSREYSLLKYVCKKGRLDCGTEDHRADWSVQGDPNATEQSRPKHTRKR
jgi:hypothetical protein